jgi:uncharacterized membrane protein YcaP (DUF421 family)
MDWSIFTPEVSILQKIIRPLIVYLFLLVAFRLAGKRELGQMTPFDLIVLLTISNVLQNAMIGADNSLSGGLIGAATLLVANGLVARLAFHAPAFARLIESEPRVLIQDGHILTENLRREVMTRTELERALRKHDVDPATEIHLVKCALLEEDGTVTVIRAAQRDLYAE